MLALAATAAAGPPWREFAPIPSPRQELGVEAIDGEVWTFGGITAQRGTAATVEVFDPESGEWREAPPLPVAVHHPAAASLAGRPVVAGGFTGLPMLGTEVAHVWMLGEDGWEALPPLPRPRGSASAVTHEGDLYVLGGMPNETDAFRFDAEAGEWEELPPLPTGRNHAAAVSLAGRVWLVGGRNRSSFTLATVEAFDPKEFVWEKRAPMPTGRSGHAAAAVAGCLHVFGGEGNPARRDGIFPQHEMLDPGSGEWRSLPDMPLARHGIEAAVVGGTVHLPGGADVAGFGTVPANDAYTPPPGLAC